MLVCYDPYTAVDMPKALLKLRCLVSRLSVQVTSGAKESSIRCSACQTTDHPAYHVEGASESASGLTSLAFLRLSILAPFRSEAVVGNHITRRIFACTQTALLFILHR